MAIRIKLDRLLLDRRLTLTDLADRIGITIANLSVLKTNKARAIRFSTLEALCRALPEGAQALLTAAVLTSIPEALRRGATVTEVVRAR